jgi:PAS domain S-box-containing protein
MAVLSLHRYADSAAASDYLAYQAAIAIPLADHNGRLDLERSPPDLVGARNEFLRGGIHPEDIPTLITIYRQMSSWRRFSSSLASWHESDRLIYRLVAVARELHAAVMSGRSTAESRRQLLDRIDGIDTRLSVLEKHASAVLDEASGLVAQLVIVALGALTIVLWGLGTAYAFKQARRQIVLDRQLACSERRFRDYAELASDGYWEMGTEGRLIYMSERLSEMLGRPHRPGQPVHDYICEHAVTLEHRDAYLTALAERRPFRGVQVEFKTGDGSQRYYALAGKPRFGVDGVFLGYRGISNDITAAVVDAKALREAKEHAEAANRAKSSFLANMSHELRTPLNAILGFADMISLRVLGEHATKQYSQYASHIHEAGTHLLAIINDILDLSRIEAGRSELSESEIGLDVLARSMRTLLDHRFKDNGTAFEIELPEPPPSIIVDERKFSQILINLLSNAFKFTPPGGRVTLGAAWRSDGGLAISVSDTGIGIAAEDIPLVLSAFGQVESMLSRQHHGTGLGLPLAKSLAELHGASLDLQSTPAVGTTVTIWLPPGRVKLGNSPATCEPETAVRAAS